MIGPSFDPVLRAAAAGDELAFGILWRDPQPGLLRYLNALAPGAGDDLRPRRGCASQGQAAEAGEAAGAAVDR